jgi:hypothetical protein
VSELGFLVGRDVVEVQPDGDGGARIIFERSDEPEPALYADIGPSSYVDENHGARPLSDMVGSVVSDTSTDGGVLVLSFEDGRTLRCEPDVEFEAWQVVGGTPQNLVVCSPGGELAVWDSSYIPTAADAQDALDQLSEITGWQGRVREVTDTGEIIVEPASEE